MKQVILWQAADGKQFECQKTCENYEVGLKAKQAIFTDIIFPAMNSCGLCDNATDYDEAKRLVDSIFRFMFLNPMSIILPLQEALSAVELSGLQDAADKLFGGDQDETR